MEQLILVVHLLAAMAIIGLILLQQGKGAEAGASFGAGASQTVFGSGGSGNFLTKATAICAVVFFVTSFALAVNAKHKAAVPEDLGILESVSESTLLEGASDLPVDEAEAVIESDLPVGTTDEAAAEGEIPSP